MTQANRAPGRKSVSFDEVAAAARTLIAEGKQPTPPLVRELLGTGLMVTIEHHLARFHESLESAGGIELGTFNVRKIELYAAHGDGGERAVGPVVGYCRTRASATALAAGKGWYGSDGAVFSVPALEIGDDVFVLASPEPIDIDGVQARRDEELRQTTLSQLTAEQRRVLGLPV